LTSPSTQSKPLRERLLPQASIRFFMYLIGVSALVMYTFRAAFVGDAFWAKIVSLLIVTCGGCFFAYATLFFLASLFTATTTPLQRSFEPLPSQRHGTGDDLQEGTRAPGGDT
jgi:hypothetical protein